MAERVWPEFQYGGPMPIVLSDEQRKDFEKLQLNGLDESVLQQIETAINDYVYAQTLEWEQLRPRQIERLLSDFDAAMTTCLSELQHISSGPHSEKLLRILEEQFEKEHAESSVDFPTWLATTMQQMKVFSSIVSGIRQSLSKKDAGRGDGKTWFPSFVYKLADIFEQLAGKEAQVVRDRVGQTYHGLFFEFVFVAMKPLDDAYRYNGLSLGKEIEVALKARRLAGQVP